MTPELAKKELAKLISDYEEHREQYHQKGYDEIILMLFEFAGKKPKVPNSKPQAPRKSAQGGFLGTWDLGLGTWNLELIHCKFKFVEYTFRNEIINRFFKILGWDVDNPENLPEYNRDVIIHYKLKGKKSATRPDYAFGLLAALKPLFFVEAKTPATIIKDHKDSAHQIRRYGKTAGLAVSILTNFEEFAVYDCTIPPRPSHSAAFARKEYFTYTQYIDNFDFFWNTFSKEAVKKGKFDKYIQTETQKKGSVLPDKGFVQKLNEWREYLATNIALNNKRLSEEDINYAVQLIIDIIIFLRFCEDRNIEHFGSLKEATQKGIIHNNLLELYHKANEKYNSGLFDFEKDTITPKIKIDNKILKNIIEELYRPKTEYEFGVMPVEILGNAYEQFLGHIIKITPSGRAKIVEKPEVKKAGGVFYTPQFIVEYIIENTVGKLIRGKTPDQISKIKIVDPACGSGSFLLGVYICLLKYHSEYYWKKGLHKKKSKTSLLTPEGKLTVAEKKRILINNIYGVDIDPNAVEVTKLSLLLKAMEGETEETIYQQLKMYNEQALPDLDNNIKCGNSLIGYDFNGGFLELNKDEQKSIEKKLKFFDWKAAFPDAFKQGGFDAVIGNPPWVSLSGKFGNDILNEDAQQYLIKKYNGNTYRPNLYEYFIHRGLELVKKNGYLSFIVPDRFGFNEQFINLRKKILNNFTIEELLYKVDFPNIVTDTLIFRIKNSQKKNYKIQVGESAKELQSKENKEYLNDNEYKFTYESSDTIGNVLNKIFENQKTKELGGENGILESKTGVILNTELVTEKRKNQKQIKILKGRNVERYYLNGAYYCEFTTNSIKGGTNDTKKLGAKEKVLLRKTGYPIYATYDNSGIFPEQSLYFLFNNKTQLSLKYITALINSKLFQFCYWHRLVTNRDSTPQLKKIDLDRFPVFILNLNDKEEKSIHDEVVRLVDTLLELNKELREAKRPNEIDRLKNRITHSENRIDELVYKLYGLSKKDILTIEKNLPYEL
jgi:hypothetical protein